MKKICLAFFLFFSLAAANLRAQPVTEENPGVQPGDPIVDMLDSLVSLSFLNRFEKCVRIPGSDTICRFAPDSVPAYPDEVYRERLRTLQSPIPLDYNSYVKEYIDVYMVKKRRLTARVVGLSKLYYPLFEEVLDANDLPLEFKHLAIVESALNPTAVSRVGATGIWQFMYNTGKIYDLHVNSYIDERRDPYYATLAACEYFKDMYAIYKDWLLVIAAYNCGPGNVNRAIARSGGKRNFWEIMRYLPRETQGYVPAFIAVNYVMNYYPEHNIVADVPPSTYFDIDTVLVQDRVLLDQVAAKLELPADLVTYLNPIYKKNLIPKMEDEKFSLRLPVNKISSFIQQADSIYYASREGLPYRENGEELKYDFVTREVKRYHTVRKGETISAVARKYQCSVYELKKWNRMNTTALRQGQKLVVYVMETVKVEKKDSLPAVAADTLHSDSTGSVSRDSLAGSVKENTATVKEALEKKPVIKTSPQVKYIYYTIQPGDTLWNIAQRYQGITVQQLKDHNKSIDHRSLKPGTKIKVPVTG